MKYLFLLVFTISCYIASAQELFVAGNIYLDSDLNAVNRQARLNISTFNNDMRLSYNVSAKTLNHMSVNLNMAPGDIYLSLEIARVRRIPVDRVITVYQSHHSKGWGAMAKELGIKPGSPEFHRLKQNGNNKNGNASAKKNKNKGKNK